ncbi:CCR4-NOT transcription complex subunit 3 isoform X1 [Dioscorea cayenensis subsp. rotundata]|uniref:CCR4-NOT transcription complex subunit 3 isoform X1 n=1 Tax=Dioscorea cayennensis subsp. rotundata TaxID=55577 RepID=A0AB40BS94_DIOCR|nr:CCR4-NOT transcription complex subunit 3 isoform X1 [Dioscorea cayenensis subsp. rotundata]
MGASRKLQGEIDRVLKKVQEGVDVFDSIWNKVYDTENANQKEKFEADLKKEIKKLQRYRDQIKTWIQSSEIKDKKVSASYEQALMDARKLIEKEMERFKVCEKETKTKAFSKEGLGQQPKTDPKEKAKSETRDWLNNVVGDLESQIDNFEAEVEGLSVKKGKTRPPRLTHLETSISRHKAHVMKLELILRLLDNDELSTDQVNDLKEFLEDYVERNQEDFHEFDDVDEFYSSLPLDKVEALEDLVTLGPSSLVKGVGAVSTSTAVGLKNSIATSSTQLPSSLSSASQQSTSSQDQGEETSSQDGTDIAPRTPPTKTGGAGSSISAVSPISVSGIPVGPNLTATATVSTRPSVSGLTAATILSAPVTVRAVTENPATNVPSSVAIANTGKEEDTINFPGRKPSPAIPEALPRGINRAVSSQPSINSAMSLGSAGGISSAGTVGLVPPAADVAKRNILSVDDRIASGGLSQSMGSPLNNRMMLPQVPKTSDGTASTDSNNVSEGAVLGGRVFGVQWRPQTGNSFPSQNEMGQFRGRPEIAPDQREKFLQKLQQVQQQGHSNLLGAPILPGASHKQFTAQQQNSLLQQFNSQSPLSPQMGLGLGVQSSGLSTVVSSPQQQQSPIHQQSTQHPLISSVSKDAVEEQQQLQSFPDDMTTESGSSSALNKIINDDDLKTPFMATGSTSIMEGNRLPRDTDLSPGQPVQPGQPSASLGVIGRRSAPDLGAIGDNLSGSVGNFGGMHDQIYNMQMLEAAYGKLPQPRDSERVKSYIPKHPADTPASYPQVQAPIMDNPAFWERLGVEPYGTDTLFFAFYYQQNTYQQFLAARELKRQSWRFHRKYNTWFQRHEEPKVTNDEFERGTYVYFDFHIPEDTTTQGWCQRIKTEFTFEYNYLEDELVVV